MKQSKRPNVLLILTDQMRSTAMGCAGVEPVFTPNLDRLASEGTRFENALTNCPSCAPARASLFTGQHVLSHGVVNNEIQVCLDKTNFAGALTQQGYRCGYIGKWHLDGGSREQFTPPGPRRLGFDDFWAVANCSHNYMDAFYYLNDDPEPRFIEGYEPEHQADLAIGYIKEKNQGDDPFFLVWSPGTPHDPFRLQPEENFDPYPLDRITFMETNSRYVPGEINRAKKEVIQGYYAHITALDRQVGRLMDTLEEEGLAKQTIVIFTADHGDMLGNKGEWFKSQPWRESVGIPMLMRWPGKIPSGKVTRGPISLIDLMPTICTLTGTDIPEDCQSDDQSSFVLGQDDRAPASAFISFLPEVHVIPSPPFRGVVTATHTYAETTEGPWVLYDDINDPLQKNNLITWANRDDSEVVALQTSLHDQLGAWLKRTRDPFDDGEVINDRYQPGHHGGVLPCQKDAGFEIAYRRHRDAKIRRGGNVTL